MKNILIKLIKNQCKCSHKHALLYQDSGYCPDCGEYLAKNYYLLRCARCDIKREAKLLWDEIVPKEKFCSNCGSEEYYIEKIDKVNFVDANYAICLKEIADKMQDLHPEAQVWVEDCGNLKQITSQAL